MVLNEEQGIKELRDKRIAYGISQGRLAVASGITREYLNKIESGKMKPSKELLNRFHIQSWKILLSSIMGKGGSTFCCRPLITHQQGQTGLSTVGAAHSLAVDWLDWICYFT